MRRLPLSFRFQLLAGCVCALILVISPFYAVEIMAARSSKAAELDRHAQVTVENIARIVSLPMWDYNYAFLEELIDGLERDPYVRSAELFDTSGELLASHERAEPVPSTWADLTLEQQVIYGQSDTPEVIGTLRVAFSGLPVVEEHRDQVRSKVLSVLALVALTGIALHVALTGMLMPLQRLVVSIGNIRKGNLESSVSDISRRDEIGKVAGALDQLRLAEMEVKALRIENDAEARRERHRLVRALQSTTDGVIVFDERSSVALQNARAREFFGPLLKGAEVDPAGLFPFGHAIPTTDLEKSADFIVHMGGASRPRDLRVRIDQIRDEAGASLGRVLLASNITEQLQQKRRADFLATHDTLTGLPNRRALEEALTEEHTVPIGLLLGDLDRFKHINDTLGHGVGDALLKRIAAILREIVGEGDLPVRLGGDEFAILARGENVQSRLEFVGDALVQRLSTPLAIDDREIQTGISLGTAYLPFDAANACELMQMADIALYDAKNAGRGRMRRFRPELRSNIDRRQAIETALATALEAGDGLWPVFQRQTCTQTGRVTGLEALARWSMEGEGPVSPAEFIPIAEESGLIRRLTRIMLDRSYAAAREIAEAGFAGRMSVNLSPMLFDGSAYRLVREALASTGCAATSAEVEITEQVLLSSREGVREEIEAIRGLGVTVALDDFGMGYSSLSYLQRFPVDKIKIDRAFVSEICRSNETRAIVRAIVDLSRALGMSVIGEGAETEAERAMLRRCGVERLQGWVDGPSLTADELRGQIDALIGGTAARYG